MPSNGWISLNDYSNRYKVSLSTLRRRIRSDEIEYELEGGRYWLPNKPIEKYVRNRAHIAAPMQTTESQTTVGAPETYSKEDVLSVAKTMLAELKAAYIHSLQEKEEQILQLRVEASDLKTLIKILESQPSSKINSAPERDAEIESWS